jgi:hypothetical protein
VSTSKVIVSLCLNITDKSCRYSDGLRPRRLVLQFSAEARFFHSVRSGGWVPPSSIYKWALGATFLGVKLQGREEDIVLTVVVNRICFVFIGVGCPLLLCFVYCVLFECVVILCNMCYLSVVSCCTTATGLKRNCS